MKKSNKILLGLATLWPFVYIVFFFLFIFSAFIFSPVAEGGASGSPLFAVFMTVHIFTMVWCLALLVFYMINVVKNDRVEKDMKILWLVLLPVSGLFAMPIYWYLYIWKEAPTNTKPLPTALRSSSTAGWVNDASTNREGQYVPPAEPPNWRE